LPAEGTAINTQAGGKLASALTASANGMRPILPASAVDISADRSVIYVAEDVGDLALMEEIIRTFPQIRFIGASTGRAGLMLARCNRPQLILIDMVLQDMTGQEALRFLRLDPDLGETAFVALSAEPAMIDRETIRVSGFDDCIQKPVDMDRFLSLIRRVFAVTDTAPQAVKALH